jgi:hypothetical protein
MLFLGRSEIYVKNRTITIDEWITIFGEGYKKNEQRVVASDTEKITEMSTCCSACSQGNELWYSI